MSAGSVARANAAVAFVLALASGGAAQAQSMINNSAALNAGYGRVAGAENSPVNVQMRDASGNLVVQNGMIQAGASGSVFASGALDSATGVGANASAIGNNLTVVTQGDNNTVIVSATQTNTGAVTATATTTAHGAP